ncbi:MAG TPA: DUF192 domain-containing protein [Elusimicrobia bacterium]|nr:MAG: hypothetical protein A2X37_02665 [Elusimicrobia bacterium GWA2_66_18]HAZ07846.1 DUF192 domain-containing protein [Elusimicrobiota bacterium]
MTAATGTGLLAAFNATRGRLVAGRVATAGDCASRNQGLLGRASLDEGEGLWIVPCPMIHTFFMKFPIDVLFLDRGLRVVRVIEDLRPWRLSPWVLSAHSALELEGGALNGSVAVGDRLEMRPA